MKPVPPRMVRRLVLAPLAAAADVAVLVLSPVLALVAVLLAPLAGGTRALRVTLIGVVFAAHHLHALLGLFSLWVRSGFGRRIASERMRSAHYAVMRRLVARVSRSLLAIARAQVIAEEPEAAVRALSSPGRAVLVLSRHAGEGDTLLVLHQLLCRHGRDALLVMHQALRLDPVIDVLGERLPNRFVDPRGGDTEVEIAALASEVGPRGALVIFPEGANFSPENRRRGIERLEQAGHQRDAAKARAMRHISAPRPGGALAAIGAARDADVIIFGHAGFPTDLREAWRLLTHKQTFEVKLWHEPAASIPRDDEDAGIAWLFERWRRLDAWVAERERPPA